MLRPDDETAAAPFWWPFFTVFEIGVFYHSYENPKRVQTNFSGSPTNTNRNSLLKVQIAPLSSGGPLQAFTFSEPFSCSVVLNGGGTAAGTFGSSTS